MTFAGTIMFTNTRRRNIFIRMLTYVMKNKIRSILVNKNLYNDYLLLLKVVVKKVDNTDLVFVEAH